MRRIAFLWIGLAAACVALGAAAAFETRASRIQAIKTVGIVSAIGEEMSLTQAGLTRPDATAQSLSISAWALDELIVQQATRLLDGRFRVQPVSYRRAAFAAIRDSAVAPVNLLRSDPFKELVRSDVAPQGLDAYIVITRARSKLGNGRSVEGVGLAQYRTLLADYGLIHALYEVRVIDGKSFNVIEKRAAGPLDNTGTVQLAGPSGPVDEALGASASSERLRAAVVDLIARSLPVTFSDMHLIGGP
ncbi:hypothetical protein C7U92_06405 [Bradyrhizobium sp. WBOS7]|uniref:Uncharacterized protein n=1 Tax=Bradyrhizobium betae TaxID=244734 RepID=A0AAE9STK9_9BRAD|nr:MULTISPECIES: hypothetical protein [Bradyrhizobium]MDD1569249.1 hypothetical protein [Bradyrhizobium sp. WBOS1]UUO38048.1 hypothetical protein DCK84_28015 [Bradyrhizobium sp. WBOS01]MDD1526976.1 hypothetical protein [Bradyrhizobium sp. WBOS2]MDD1576368.1 hypothetical protein [Bradyrhizobium sp. WBOS7]MDD1603809.1 hypothetical protein [Bradyrhizobium sp. WBOS16]